MDAKLQLPNIESPSSRLSGYAATTGGAAAASRVSSLPPILKSSNSNIESDNLNKSSLLIKKTRFNQSEKRMTSEESRVNSTLSRTSSARSSSSSSSTSSSTKSTSATNSNSDFSGGDEMKKKSDRTRKYYYLDPLYLVPNKSEEALALEKLRYRKRAFEIPFNLSLKVLESSEYTSFILAITHCKNNLILVC